MNDTMTIEVLFGVKEFKEPKMEVVTRKTNESKWKFWRPREEFWIEMEYCSVGPFATAAEALKTLSYTK